MDSVTAAAATVDMPADFRVSIANPTGNGAYPIASFTWLLVPVPGRDAAKTAILADFLKWMLADGQKLAPRLDYAPLPNSVIEKVREQIKQVQ